MKRLTRILFVSAALFFCTSCINEYLGIGNRITPFDFVVDDMRLLFLDTKYPFVEDSTIVKESFKPIGTGQFVDVTYQYGAIQRTRYYYQDENGRAVRIKVGTMKSSGYPSTRSVIWDINRHGHVVVDWIWLACVILFFALLVNIFSL